MSSESARAGMAGGVVAAAPPLLAFADALLAKGAAELVRGPAEIRQYVTFFLREEEYGVPILQCREIVRVPAITRVPETPAHVRGVVNLRGRIVPAVDTRTRLGLEPVTPTAKSRMLVVEVSGRQLALLVDRVARILKLAVTDIEPAPNGWAPPGSAGMARVGDARVHLLDAERLLRDGAPAGPTTKGEAE